MQSSLAGKNALRAGIVIVFADKAKPAIAWLLRTTFGNLAGSAVDLSVTVQAVNLDEPSYLSLLSR
jgi:hypothetical protein